MHIKSMVGIGGNAIRYLTVVIHSTVDTLLICGFSSNRDRAKKGLIPRDKESQQTNKRNK